MKIAFTAKGNSWSSEMDSRFGRADFILIYDDVSGTLNSFDNRAIADVAHGAGPKTAQKILELEPAVLITGNGPGGNAAAVLNEGNIKVFVGAANGTVKDALEKYKKAKLQAFNLN